RRYATVAVSLAVNGAFLTMFYFMPPSTQALSLDNIDASSRMVQYLDDARETVDEEEIEWANSNAAGGEPGERAAGEEGAAGRDDAPVTHRRQAVRGPADNTDPHMARERLRENMAEATAIGTLASFLGSMDAPTSPFGRNEALGRDDVSAIGELMGDQMGDSFGQFGAGMRGTGVGAGGTGVGTYGVGPLGTLGVGGNGHGGRYGDGVSLGSGGHVARVPRIIGTNATVLGGLSREAIQRVVRRNMNQVRFCYEQGLSTNPSLEGRVTVGWIISPTGAVSQSSVQQDTVNPEVASCIANAVRRWSFPQPDGGGPVGVNYPFLLQTN
ncbi:MAG: AgmX/PglI C-terminal domain-containing protein, partial [Sandaracinaceae bacterium]